MGLQLDGCHLRIILLGFFFLDLAPPPPQLNRNWCCGFSPAKTYRSVLLLSSDGSLEGTTGASASLAVSGSEGGSGSGSFASSPKISFIFCLVLVSGSGLSHSGNSPLPFKCQGIQEFNLE